MAPRSKQQPGSAPSALTANAAGLPRGMTPEMAAKFRGGSTPGTPAANMRPGAMMAGGTGGMRLRGGYNDFASNPTSMFNGMAGMGMAGMGMGGAGMGGGQAPQINRNPNDAVQVPDQEQVRRSNLMQRIQMAQSQGMGMPGGGGVGPGAFMRGGGIGQQPPANPYAALSRLFGGF